jgi:hypothetical protein
MKSKSQIRRSVITACTALLGVSAAHGSTIVESFESGTLNGWNPGTINSSITTVNTDRATEGINSVANSFTVPASLSGWSVSTIIEIDPRNLMDAGATTLSLDAYSNWANPNGWGLYGNTILLVLYNNSNGWTAVNPTTGALVNDEFSTLTWDLTPHAAAITDPGLEWSNMSLVWHVGTWAGGEDSLDNGTQTLAIDNIVITSVPEPSSVLALLTGGLLVLRRRR